LNYAAAVEWLYAQVPLFQRDGASAYKPGLDRIQRFLTHLGNPHLGQQFIHVAGTNGKGSTCSLLASVLTEAGFTTGLFTSPHLKDFRERIRINGVLIPEERVKAFIHQEQHTILALELSFFEVTTALALLYFQEAKTDWVVLETGMGGRLDATNIVLPQLSIITNIGMDHMAYLGNTLEAIAGEKAGIIKAGVPVVIGPHQEAVLPVFEQKAAELGSSITVANPLANLPFHLPLQGHYQQFNLATVLCALQVLGLPETTDAVIQRGLDRVVTNTGLRGRWEILGHAPLTIADTAHNEHGLRSTLNQIQSLNQGQLHCIIGFVGDKDLQGILPLFPVDAQYYFCGPAIPRGLPAQELQKRALEFNLKGKVFPSVASAFLAAQHSAQARDTLYIGGSTFVVAEIL
jgi:dihydrofolate synthase/folylpolyglutamate synthase